jgi:endonuclease YncB( thermonuclease family)
MRKPFSKAPVSGASALLLIFAICVSVFSQTIVFSGRVVHVTGGDTVTVLTKSNTEFQVRCQGINAPKGQEDFAAESRQRLMELLDQPVTVRYSKRDDDGALAGAIFLDSRNICLEQVKAGMAWYDDQSEQSRSTKQQYARAEAGARNNQVGLWTVARNTSTSLSTGATETNPSDRTADVRGYFRKDGTYIAAYQRTPPDNSFTNQVGTRRSRWLTALKWVGIGATVGALLYLNARYPTLEPGYGTPLARCNDGTLSYSQTRRGTCSHHGGVRYWLR